MATNSQTELSGYVLEPLRRDPEFNLYRGRKHGNDVSVLVLAPAVKELAAAKVARLGHEYALAAELESEWAARPLALVDHDGRPMLVLEDPGGDPLDLALTRPLELTRFLRLAIGATLALAQAHRRGFVHKDIKPANLIVDAAGKVRLTGFGVASRLPRELQMPGPPEAIAGTLAYMAPEQTGRMNRSVDTRSDLYSLGVTFYEMLTAALPFTAAGPLEWIHCHIARQPIPLRDRVPDIPEAIASIVSKLLAKDPEERYQSATGLGADLRRCLADWEAQGRIEPFVPAAHDGPDRLTIPGKLYGREREVDALASALERVVRRGRSELVLVSGESGIGKSSLAHELHKVLVPSNGLFAAGKYDRYKRDIPYAILARAFQSLVREILTKSETEVDQWRASVQEAVGTNGQLMVNLIPELDLLIGKQPVVAELGPQDSQSRFQAVFLRFVGAFARRGRPLALLLDDLQWVDDATLDLLTRLLVEPREQYLLLVGAYRRNEIGPSHPLARALAAIRQAGASVQEIVLAPLTQNDIAGLLADALRSDRDRLASLAELVHAKTGGNPFFAIQFILTLAEDKLLAFDPVRRVWTWDSDRIRAEGFAEDVADLMGIKLSRLSEPAREILKRLACLGNTAEIDTLSLLHGESGAEGALWEGVRAGVIFRTNGDYAFVHDRVREAAYTLIPEDKRAAMHIGIARAIASQTVPDRLEEKAFEIVNQFNRGAALITTPQEREFAATLNLMAGKRAKKSAAYGAAAAYLTAGRALLDEDRWTRQYRLAFDLEFQQAEYDFMTASFLEAESRLLMLMRRAENRVDSAAVTRLLASLYIALNRTERSGEVCLEYLRSVSADWSANPSDDEVREEYRRVWLRLGDRSIEDLGNLPPMTDPDVRATLEVLTSIAPPGILANQNLHRRVVGRMVNLTLEHGNSDASCVAYVLWGMILRSHFGEYDAAFRFGKLALDLVERTGLDRFKARVYLDFATVVNPWTRHLSTGLPLLRRAFASAQESGDLTFMAYSCNNLVTNLLANGERLDEVRREAEKGMEFARKARFALVIDVITGQLQLIRALRGLTLDLSSFADAEFDEQQFERRLEDERSLALASCSYWIRKLQAQVYAGAWAPAMDAAAKVQGLLWASSPAFGPVTLSSRLSHAVEMAEYHFYAALALAGAPHDAISAEEHSRRSQALAAHHRQIEIWADHCPDNFRDRGALVAAEIARFNGEELKAERLYQAAIRAAREHGFTHHEALANELAGRFHLARDLPTIADAYLRNARYCYERWGAIGKSRQLDQHYPGLSDAHSPAISTSTIATSIPQLDIDTVLRASRAVSGEIILDKLIEILMTMALEHAGAERGVLILRRGAALNIVAEAQIHQGTVHVDIGQAAVTSAAVPESLLQAVLRTRRSVILEDACQAHRFAADPYVQRRQSRSVLCLPLVKLTDLVGMIFLENNLMPAVFTPERVAILEFLSSQAAISLENAGLYRDLVEENHERRRAEQALRASEASLAEGQRISRTGTWRWNVRTGALEGSNEYIRILGIDPATEPMSYARYMQAVHPDDRDLVERALAEAARRRRTFEYQNRIVLPNGSVRHVESSGHLDIDESGELEFVGTVMDVTERRLAEEALRRTQDELASASRLATMGELAGSIIHEVNQPLAAILTNAQACLRWLNRDQPNLAEAHDCISSLVRDCQRASDVIKALNALARKSGLELGRVDINDAIREVLTIVRGELERGGVVLRVDLFALDKPVLGDRAQLQQVLLNLIRNGIEAMAPISGRARLLRVSAGPNDGSEALIGVEDTGVGLDSTAAGRIFSPLFTTKANGMGMGLAICRSIIEAHRGRLWASPNTPHGTVFRFTVPLFAADQRS